MKKIQYIFAPAIVLAFLASCNSAPQGPSQAEIDTQVEAKVKAATEQLKAECDSRIMAAAQLKKDSILVKMGMQKAAPAAKAAGKTDKEKTPIKVVPPPQPAPAPAPAPANPKADRFDKKDGKKTVTDANTKGKEDRFAGGEKKEVTPEDTKKKAERFNR